MHMKLTDEQAQLRDSAARFMDEECTMDFVREIEKGDVGYSPDMWKRRVCCAAAMMAKRS